MPRVGDHYDNVLLVASQIRRHGRVDDGAHERAGRRKPALKKMYFEEKLKAEIVAEALEKK